MTYSTEDKAVQRLSDAERRAAAVLVHFETVTVRVYADGTAVCTHGRLDRGTGRMTFRPAFTPVDPVDTAELRAQCLAHAAGEVLLDAMDQQRLW